MAFSSYREVIDTAADDSDDLFLDESENGEFTENRDKDDSPLSVSVSSTEDISTDVVEIPDDNVVDVPNEPLPGVKVSTPKLKQSKITSMLTPKSKKTILLPPSSTIPLSSNKINEQTNIVPPPGKKFVPKIDYLNQEQKVMKLKQNLHQTRNALKTLNLETLPDRGAMLINREVKLTNELVLEEEKFSTMIIEPKTQNDGKDEKVYGLSWQELKALSNLVQPAGFGGKQAMETYHTQKTLTMDRLKLLHRSLESKPTADVMEDNPKYLKIELMPHQKHALAFLLWRENQKPAGGILADDMGLGKTLTMISLILKSKELSDEENKSDTDGSSNDENKEDDDEWKNKRKPEYYHGGTLVICPASLINQWENEIIGRCKRDCLSVYLYHGSNREFKSRRIAKHDVVITTYNIVGIDQDKPGGIFGVRWRRIILDEAHVIRNSKSKCSLAVCKLKAKKRWCLTGTPVHNKELDLYALLKFLKCTPFDDITIWKKWIDNKTAGGQDRLNTVIQTIMLRRTKKELQENDAIMSLPEKKTELINVKLTKDEMNIYQKILLISKTLFAQFLHQRAEKNSDLIYSSDRKQKFINGNPNPEYEKVHKKLLRMHGTDEVKAHVILVLLLRLRQICCHVSLVKSMIENENCTTDGIEDTEGNDIDLLEQLEKLGIDDEEEDTTTNSSNTNDNSTENETNLNTAASKLINPMNPIFDSKVPSSKIKTVIHTLKTNAIAKGDKAIIVSQWTSMLKIIEEHLRKDGVKCETLDGSVPVKKRMGLVDEFNRQSSNLQVLLLSLTAGGVGLNLVGANHLLLIDLHWNPQLESQAQDRIYRFGQKKDVFIYKFVTLDTIEERIKALQENKLAMADSLLTGTKRTGPNKLTIDDLKMLFDMT